MSMYVCMCVLHIVWSFLLGTGCVCSGDIAAAFDLPTAPWVVQEARKLSKRLVVTSLQPHSFFDILLNVTHVFGYHGCDMWLLMICDC